jgi:hypothetical protein
MQVSSTPPSLPFSPEAEIVTPCLELGRPSGAIASRRLVAEPFQLWHLAAPLERQPAANPTSLCRSPPSLSLDPPLALGLPPSFSLTPSSCLHRESQHRHHGASDPWLQCLHLFPKERREVAVWLGCTSCHSHSCSRETASRASRLSGAQSCCGGVRNRW